VTRHDAGGGDRYVAVPLGYWKALSASFTRASGTATLNLVDGAVSVAVSGLPAGPAWDVWLVDNRPGPRRSVRPEPADTMLRIGRLVKKAGTTRLDAELGPAAFTAFHVDLVVVAPAGGDPGTTGLLFGAPSLFQRLYTSRRSPTLLRLSDFTSQPGIGVERRWASLVGATAAEADDTGIVVNEDVVFTDLVRKGAELFFNERFDGNGRTCATCHRKDANFTVDVNFIASLRDDDPLFVAEFTPALAFSPFGPKFEVPVLMRGAGLIVENVDGTDDLVNKFVMRGVPHTIGMRNSLADATITAGQPRQRTGWGGDGAPNDGTLRDFATGAVTQHFTKTLRRRPGTDFRLPTDAELNAMEAFQLSLGRQTELNLAALQLKDARATRGKELFVLGAGQGGGGGDSCHSNAGANDGNGNNRNRNTGVEAQPDRPAELILRALNLDLTPDVPSNVLPRHGGFGRTPGDHVTGFGDGRFNTVSLVEAADTPPFFHDSSIETIEGAVAFYNSRSFNNAPDGRGIALEATQVEAIAAFLRVINALDNIREATEAAGAAKTLGLRDARAAAQLLKQATKETGDAMTVLFARSLHPAAVRSLDSAMESFGRATGGSGTRLSIDRSQIDRGLGHLAAARRDIVR
jgi:cytochrome c peroxidase